MTQEESKGTYTERINAIVEKVDNLFSSCTFLEPQDLGTDDGIATIADDNMGDSTGQTEKEIPGLTLALELLAELKEAAEKTIFALDDAYDHYFNDQEINKIVDGMGDGQDFLKGNSFCVSIGRDYTFPNVRDLIWTHLPLYVHQTNILNKIEDNILSEFENKMNELEDIYSKNYGGLGTGGGISTIADDNNPNNPVTEIITPQYIFWEQYQPDALISQTISQILQIFKTLEECGNKFKSLTKDWFNLAMEALTTLSLAIHLTDEINHINDEKIFPTIAKNVDDVNRYSDRVVDLYRIVEPIAQNFQQRWNMELPYTSPVMDMDDNSEPCEIQLPEDEETIYDVIKVEVFNYLNVEPRSKSIYDQMENNFLIIETP